MCLLGLLGPALDNPNLRLIGVAGYGIVLPATSVLIGLVFWATLHNGLSPGEE
jgi:hypothetical protein